MANIAATRRAHSLQMRRAVSLHHNKRRNANRGYPDLHQTHRIAIGNSLSIPTNFPDVARPVTFKFRVDRTGSSATGTIATLGDQGTIGFQSGNLEIVTGGGATDTFTGTFIGAPRDSAEVVVAINPASGEVRAWVDSSLIIAGTVTTFPFSWATTGLLDYDGIIGVDVRSDFDVFVGQLPKRFVNAVSALLALEGILLRAAKATFRVGRWPFTGQPNI